MFLSKLLEICMSILAIVTGVMTIITFFSEKKKAEVPRSSVPHEERPIMNYTQTTIINQPMNGIVSNLQPDKKNGLYVFGGAVIVVVILSQYYQLAMKIRWIFYLELFLLIILLFALNIRNKPLMFPIKTPNGKALIFGSIFFWIVIDLFVFTAVLSTPYIEQSMYALLFQGTYIFCLAISILWFNLIIIGIIALPHLAKKEIGHSMFQKIIKTWWIPPVFYLLVAIAYLSSSLGH